MHEGRGRPSTRSAQAASPGPSLMPNEMRNAAMANPIDIDRMTCPTPLTDYDHVLLGHGSGGG